MTQPHHEPPSSEHTRIIRRTPTGPIPTSAPGADDTRIIRRAPTGAVPDEAGSVEVSDARRGAGAATAVAACVVAMVSGWATSVLATDLITGWWNTDRLFCVAVGFLALVFSASTVSGVVLLLRRRAWGRYLIAVGAVVALLAFAGVFIAGAKIPWIVYAIPALPIASAALALHPATQRWAAD